MNKINPVEHTLERINKVVGRWLHPDGIPAKEAVRAIAGILIDVRLPPSIYSDAKQGERAAVQLKEGLAFDLQHENIAVDAAARGEQPGFIGLATKKEDLLDTLQRAIDSAEHSPGRWREGLAAGGSIAFGDYVPISLIGKTGHRCDARLAIAAVNALPKLLERIRLTEHGERAANQEVARLQARLDDQVKLYNQLIDATHAERDQLTIAARDVLVERRRQVEKEGWTPEHDDEHEAGEFAAAGAAYALNAADQLHPQSQGDGGHAQPDCWPWDSSWWKPGVPRRDLVKAGALILAEIERWDMLIARGAGELYTAAEEARMDVIGLNGNGGEHYAELDNVMTEDEEAAPALSLEELAIQNGGKPIEELPGGLSWEQAPEWAMVLLDGHVDGASRYSWAERHERDAIRQYAGGGGITATVERSELYSLIATRPALADGRDATQV